MSFEQLIKRSPIKIFSNNLSKLVILLNNCHIPEQSRCIKTRRNEIFTPMICSKSIPVEMPHQNNQHSGTWVFQECNQNFFPLTNRPYMTSLEDNVKRGEGITRYQNMALQLSYKVNDIICDVIYGRSLKNKHPHVPEIRAMLPRNVSIIGKHKPIISFIYC